jgi:hypothetical protein
MTQPKWFTCRFPIDDEVGIDRTHLGLRMEFRQPDQTGVSQGHGNVPVSPPKSPDEAGFGEQGEITGQVTPLDPFEDLLLGGSMSSKQVERLGDDRFTNEYRTPKSLELRDRPEMVSVGSVQERHQRSGVEHHAD